MLQRLAKKTGLRQNFVPVGQQNIAPDRRVTGRDAGEVAKAGAAKRQKTVGLWLCTDAVHQRERQQVRQVADCGKSGIVRFGRHVRDMAAQRGPDIVCLLQLDGERALGGRQDDLAALVKRCIGVLDASHLAPCNGVRRYKRANLVAQRLARCLHHVGLGRAHVHHQHVWRDQVLDGAQRGFGGGHGHGHQHDVRA